MQDDPDGIAFSADSKLFAVTSGSGARYTKVWDTADRREVARLGGGGYSVAFSPDGRRLAIGDADEKAVVVWDLESRRQLVALAGEGSIFNGVGFSPDGNVIGSGNSRGDVYLCARTDVRGNCGCGGETTKEDRGTMTPSSEEALFAFGDIRDGDIVLRTRPKCFARTINSSTREIHQEPTVSQNVEALHAVREESSAPSASLKPN